MCTTEHQWRSDLRPETWVIEAETERPDVKTSVHETMAIPAKHDRAGTRQALTPPRHTGAVAIIPMTRSCAREVR